MVRIGGAAPCFACALGCVPGFLPVYRVYRVCRARKADCPYRNQVMPCLRMHALREWLPHRDWLSPPVPYVDEITDREVMRIFSTQDLPYPHNFTPCCGMDSAHAQLLASAVAGIRSRSARLIESAVMKQAVRESGGLWTERLTTGGVPSCPLRSATRAQFDRAVMLAISWIKGDVGAESEIQPTGTDTVRLIAWSLIDDPGTIGSVSGELGNGQVRNCQASLLDVDVAPVSVLE